MLKELMRRVYSCNMELTKNNLVVWTSGNASGRICWMDGQAVVIKPSGVPYERLAPSCMVALNLEDGALLDVSQLKPSVDTPTHLYIYKNMPEVNGVCHTHSPYATAFAACGRDLTCALTAMADEFGNSVLCTQDVLYGGDIQLAGTPLVWLAKAGAILLRNHGVLTIGKSPEEAVKRAVMVEDCAKTLWYAEMFNLAKSGYCLGSLPIPEIEQAHERYKNGYGQ